MHLFLPNNNNTNNTKSKGNFPGAGARALSVRMQEGYHGTVSYNARVQDSAGAYSLQLSLTVHVMISPCVHGDCRATALGQTCLDPQRAATFDPFRCHCDPGYEGRRGCEETGIHFVRVGLFFVCLFVCLL